MREAAGEIARKPTRMCDFARKARHDDNKGSRKVVGGEGGSIPGTSLTFPAGGASRPTRSQTVAQGALLPGVEVSELS